MSYPNDISQTYQRLIASRDKALDANESIKADIRESRAFQDEFCCNTEIYRDQIAIVAASKPNIVIEDTVGSYLYACFQPELAVKVACTPSCTTGLKNPDLPDCTTPSYEKKAGQLKKLNNITGDIADVYLASGQSITQGDREALVRDNVRLITIYEQDGETIDYILGETIDVTQPPPQPNPPVTPTGWIWLALIVLIVVILLLVVFANRR